MNFLAHIYLSGNDKDLILGNFIADMVKGKQIERYEERVIGGIKMHRIIDKYTDEHPVVSESKKRLRKNFSHYSPVIADMYYDHFLAKNWENYSEVQINDFLKFAYNVLLKNYLILPSRGRRILPFMVANNWLGNYADFNNLQRNFEGLARRTSFNSGMEKAVDELKLNYNDYYAEFKEFFPQLTRFVKEQIIIIK